MTDGGSSRPQDLPRHRRKGPGPRQRSPPSARTGVPLGGAGRGRPAGRADRGIRRHGRGVPGGPAARRADQRDRGGRGRGVPGPGRQLGYCRPVAGAGPGGRAPMCRSATSTARWLRPRPASPPQPGPQASAAIVVWGEPDRQADVRFTGAGLASSTGTTRSSRACMMSVRARTCGASSQTFRPPRARNTPIVVAAVVVRQSRFLRSRPSAQVPLGGRARRTLCGTPDSASSSPRGSHRRWRLPPRPGRGTVVRAHTLRTGPGRRRDPGAVPRPRRRSPLPGTRRAARIAPGPIASTTASRSPTHTSTDDADVGVREPAASLVVADERVPLAEPLKPVAPHRALPVEDDD